MANFFDEGYYFAHKVAQLAKEGYTAADGSAFTETTLKAYFADNNIDAATHYKEYGRGENLNPNPYFNENEYLTAKKALLAQTDPTWGAKSIDDLRDVMAAAGVNPAEHYETFGAFESDANGVLLNPSNAFDANAYFSAKLVELRASGYAGAETMTVAQVMEVFKEAGTSPVSHYTTYGAAEATAGSIPLVQTVPSEQRVANDPTRTENVPGNYNPPTVGAANPEAPAAPVTKPADVGAKVPASVSPTVVPPSKPLPTPADGDAYVKPPANLEDTNDNPVVIVPPAKPGDKPQYGIDKGDGTIVKPGTDGKPSDEVIGGVGDDGEIKPVDPTPDPTPEPKPEEPGTGGGGGGGGDDGPSYTNDFLGRIKADTFQGADWTLSDKDGSSSDHDTVIFDMGHGTASAPSTTTTTATQLYAAIKNLKYIEQVNLESMTVNPVDVAAIVATNAQVKFLGFSDNQATGDSHKANAATVFTNLTENITVVHTKYDVMGAADGDGKLHDSLTNSDTADALVKAKEGFGYASVALGATNSGDGTVNLITERSLTNDKGTGVPAGYNETLVLKNMTGGANTTQSSFTTLNISGEGNVTMDNSGGDRATTINAANLTGTLTYVGSSSGDSIIGGAGKDSITGGSGNDKIYGDGGPGTDNFYSGDTITAASATGSTFIGGNGADTIRGTDKNDTIHLGASNGTDTGTAPDSDARLSYITDETFKTATTGAVNLVNGWLGNDIIHASTAKDVFEYHTHVKEASGSDVRGYAATSFKALGTDTIHGFNTAEDVLLINMVELADGGKLPANATESTPGTGHGITRGNAFADLLLQSDVKEANVTWGNASVTAVDGVVKVNVSNATSGYEVKFYFGDTTDTLTINLVGVTNGAGAYTGTDLTAAKALVADLLAGDDWLSA